VDAVVTEQLRATDRRIHRPAGSLRPGRSRPRRYRPLSLRGRRLDGASCSCALGPIGWVACTIYSILQQRILEGELRLVEAVNETIRLGGAPGKRIVNFRQIRPAGALPVGVVGFADQRNIDAAFDLGVADGSFEASAWWPPGWGDHARSPYRCGPLGYLTVTLVDAGTVPAVGM
jgi:hypothetical protein